MDSVISGPDTTHTCRLYLAMKGSGAAVGVGEFAEQPIHNSLSVCMDFLELGEWYACGADMSV